MNHCVDFSLIEQVPNKYDLSPSKLKKLKVVNWDKLKKITWFNEVTVRPCWCYLCGCQPRDSRVYDDFSEFWIGFFENGEVDFNFLTWDGMCLYKFENFYNAQEIENDKDLQVQINAIEYLNVLLDEGILSLNE